MKKLKKLMAKWGTSLLQPFSRPYVDANVDYHQKSHFKG